LLHPAARANQPLRLAAPQLKPAAMDTPEDATRRTIRGESLRRAVALGEELMRLADDLGMPVAGLHICQGVEMMRDEADGLTGASS
jgi:hypothetical protein